MLKLTLPFAFACVPSFHHTKLPAYFEEMKKYHLAHHYNNFDLGYGVTSKLWDWVFSTQLVMNPKEKAAMGM